jgi:aldehyde:ferredoxin oxidoreductase
VGALAREGVPHGYCGRILRVDLGSGQLSVDTPDESFYRRYLGGGAVAAYYLLNEMGPNADPLGAENLLVVASSVAVGVAVSGYVRYTVAAKSPLTNAFGESEAGGFWGPELKHAGFDAIVVRGISPEPVYLWIHDGEAELRSAQPLWGKLAAEVERQIRDDLGDDRIRVLQTGPAGEKLVRFACVGNNLRHFNGRCGMGAVMGSKRLRAIAVRGHGRQSTHDQEQIREVARWFNDQKPHPLTDLGSPSFLSALQKSGILPTRNFREGVFEGAEAISGERMKETIGLGNEGCWACSVRCKRRVATGPPYNVEDVYGGPEYETLAAFGSNCGVADLAAIARANEICNAYLMDTISAGAAVGFAMECYEKGLLTTADADGLDLRFGNAPAMVALTEKIARREGLGDLLAEGVMRAAAQIGGHAEEIALHVKGQELPMHDPRGKPGVGMGYALSPTGADHLEAPHDGAYRAAGPALERMGALGLTSPVDLLSLGPEKVRAFVLTQCLYSLYNSMGFCNYCGLPAYPMRAEQMTRVMNAVTGWEMSFYELMKVGERAITMARLFNRREGLTARDDRLPERLHGPLPSGPLEGRGISRDEFGRALGLYYEAMGWDRETGIPTTGKLVELGLDWALTE